MNEFVVRKGLIVSGSSNFENIITGSIVTSLSSSVAENAVSSSYSDTSVSSSYSLTSSFSEQSVSSSYSTTSSFSQTASYVENAVSSSYALTASYALNVLGGGGASGDNSYIKGRYLAPLDTIPGTLLAIRPIVVETGSLPVLGFADRGLNASEILPAAGMLTSSLGFGQGGDVSLVTNGVVNIELPNNFSGSAGDDLWLKGFDGERFAYFTATKPTGSYIQKVGKLLNTSGSQALIYVDIVQEWDDKEIAISASYAATASYLEGFSPVLVSASAPTSQSTGTLWFNLDSDSANGGELFIQLNDNGSAWVPAIDKNVDQAISSSFSLTASYSETSALATSSSYSLTATSASYALTASYVKLDEGKVLISETGSWTVTPGQNTYSFTVPDNNTYVMWMRCNIPNGIVTWNATATITNNNVPVVGAQYAWVYTGGTTPIDLVTQPTQFVGTNNSIVRSVGAGVGTTTNRFDFVLNNTSGGNVPAYYGYTQL
jgi:hypothetical protein